MSALVASPQGAESHEDGIGGDGEVAEDPAPVAIPLALSLNPLNILHGEVSCACTLQVYHGF